MKRTSNTEVRSPAERHAAMTWAQRLKRVFNIDIEVCSRRGGSVRVIACIEDQDIIDRILAHLSDKERAYPASPLLLPRAWLHHPERHLRHYLFSREGILRPYIGSSMEATENTLVWRSTDTRSAMAEKDLQLDPCERDFSLFNDERSPSSRKATEL